MFPPRWTSLQSSNLIILVLLARCTFTFATEINIAPRATLNATTALVYENHDYRKENAVDGRTSQNTDTCACCYISAQERSPYFEAYFKGYFAIDRIVVTGRQDMSTGLHREFDLTGLTARLDNTAARVTIDSSRRRATVYPTVHSSPIHAIRLSIHSLIDLRFLIICELEVMSSGCIDGYYGANCNETCGACITDNCYKSSGRCFHGCLPGFQGTRCDGCSDGYYGAICNETCGACTVDRCDRSSGHCYYGCSPGFRGDLCDSCTDGYYGAACNVTCGNCTGVACDMVSGRCLQGCVAGYQGDTCDTECADGLFGPNCVQSCHCQNQTDCDKETGDCLSGCDTGWTGFNCSVACPDGTYGEDCNMTCHCRDQGHCNRFHGNCSTGCDHRWTGFNCSIAVTPLYPINASVSRFIGPNEHNVHAVNTSVPLVYLGKSYNMLYVTKDGFVSLGKAAAFRHLNWSSPDISPYVDIPFIAPYYFQGEDLDVMADYKGAVTYREFNSDEIAHMNLSKYIHSEVVGSGGFSADWAMQVTWLNVTSMNQVETGPCRGTYSRPCPTNTFQLLLLSNGIDSYAIFNYDNMSIPPEKYDQAGFNGGEGLGWTHVLASGGGLDKLRHQQRSDIVGRYIFKISSRQIIKGGCYKNPNQTDLNVFPNYAGMMGGKMVDISGPCFSTADDIRCRFGSHSHQPGGQPPQVTKAIYVSQTRVRCMVPRLLVRDKIWLSLTLDGSFYAYQTPFNIIFVGRMPDTEHVIALPSPDAANSWLSKSPTALTLTWDGNLLSKDPNAAVDISLIGYKETGGQGEFTELSSLGTWVRASAGTYTFHTAEHQCRGNECFEYEIGLLVVTLQDRFVPNAYRYLSSKVLPLGWWAQNAMASTRGANWPSALCVDWYNTDRQDTTWLQSLLPCPCSLEQSLADFGRWQPDVSCNIVNVNSSDNCFYHKGATHCVRAVQPVGQAGNQCCYNQHGQLVFAQDTFSGSTPDRSHDWGAAPYGRPGFVPALSHWLTDVVTFYYCCLWNEYSSCDYYMDSRPTRDCSGYTAPAIASVYGEGHIAPFGGPSYNFRIVAPGDYTLLKAGNTIIQGRFERSLFPNGGTPVSSVYSLTAVAVENVGTSDRVELFLRGPDMNNDHQKIDVTVNGEFLTFDDHALAWHDLRGVAVINTDRERRVQSNVTVILTNNIGLQVVEVANTLQLDVVMPPDTLSNLTGLMGDVAGNYRTPAGIKVDIQALRNSSDHLYQAFLVPWMIRDRNSSLIRGFQYAHQHMLGPIVFDPKPVPGCSSSVCVVVTQNASLICPFDPKPVPGCSSSVCGDDAECQFDMSMTCSEELAQATRQAVARLMVLRQYLQPVRSCGFLDVPRAVKTNYDCTLGTTTTIQKCRVGVLSGPATYTCTSTSNQTQAWSPAVRASCGNATLPTIIG